MPQADELVLDFATGGMNSAVNPASIEKQAVVRMTNCRIDNQCPTTRYGVRFHALDGEGDDFRKLPLQGAAFYNPGLGQSQQRFGADRDSIVVAAGGNKLQVHVSDAEAIAWVSNITGGRVTDKNVLLVHLAQAENYLIASDGVSDCWIWAGSGQAFFSTGYNSVNKEDSRLANGATLALYAHGRILQLVDGNKVLVGDIIHKNELTTSRNILETTEQVYWATGTHFAAPSNLGEARAMAILPLRNTLHGHSDVIVHYRNGTISLKVDHYPRSQWSELALSKHVLLDTGAQGPYAVALVDGDQYFRSRTGIQTLRSAAASSDNENNPQKPISGPVQDWLDADYQAFLRYAEVEKWLVQRRVFATTGLWVESSWRGARGIVSLNIEPVRSISQGQFAWEGLWTMPPGYESIVHMVNGTFNERDRMFLICTGRKGTEFTNSLGEIRHDLDEDELEDGTSVPISCQLMTRAVSAGNRHIRKAWQNGSLYLSNIKGSLQWGVWCREDHHGPWVLWKSGTACTVGSPCAPSAPCATQGCDDEFLIEQSRQSARIGLGTIPDELKNARSVQFLIRWRGIATIEAMKVYLADAADPGDGGMEEPESCLAKPAACDYDDFEYSDPLNRWEDKL
jgi:hypothetical protein